MPLHVFPPDDLREHELSIDCWCHPEYDDEIGVIVLHHSMDGRELFERGERLPS